MGLEPESLIGRPVRHRELRLGTVAAVLVSAGSEAVVAMVVASSWDGPDRVLPFAAATVGPDVVESSPLAFLSVAEASFYLRRGARRIPALPEAEARGLSVAG